MFRRKQHWSYLIKASYQVRGCCQGQFCSTIKSRFQQQANIPRLCLQVLVNYDSQAGTTKLAGRHLTKSCVLVKYSLRYGASLLIHLRPDLVKELITKVKQEERLVSCSMERITGYYMDSLGLVWHKEEPFVRDLISLSGP